MRKTIKRSRYAPHFLIVSYQRATIYRIKYPTERPEFHSKTALVTGGNRGLGLEVCRLLAKNGVTVVLGSRNRADGEEAAHRLWTEDRVKVFPCRLDVRRPVSITAATNFAIRRFGHIDILINNAGVFLDASPTDEGIGPNSIFAAKTETLLRTFETNTLGALRVCQAVVPKMRERGYGRVVNVSSGDGRLADMAGGRPAYRISKAALNAVTRIFAGELRGTNVLINSVCPGWMRTRMGGPNARRSPAEGADTVVWLALSPDNGPQGCFFRDRQLTPW